MAITGTNGKSTTTALAGHLFASAGRDVDVGGNIGKPALELAPLGPEGTYVLEMSSYQLELTPSLLAEVAVLLNGCAPAPGPSRIKRGWVLGKGCQLIFPSDEIQVFLTDDVQVTGAWR